MNHSFRFWSHPVTNHVLQFIFIFSSVYFAFWLTNRNELRKLKTDERTAVAAVYLELRENSEQLQEAIPYHEALRQRLKSFTDSMNNNLVDIRGKRPDRLLMQFITRSRSFLGIPSLSNNAWQTLQNSPAYRLLDYEIASSLSELYQWQEIGVDATAKHIAMDIFQSRELFQPSSAEAILNQCFWSFRELAGQESFLRKRTNETIARLEEHYPWLKAEETKEVEDTLRKNP